MAELEENKQVMGAAVMEAVEETDNDDPGYLDVDMVNLDNDFQIMTSIRKLSDTTCDKLIFTISTVNLVVVAFLAGYAPQYYYISHTFEAILLISYRWYTYKKIKSHYYLLDFCYFTNILILFYMWFPFLETIRASIFPILFCFSTGPLLAATVIWRNSVVPHSVDKMTSAFIHVSPAIALWGIKWYSTNEQGFPLCTTHKCDDMDIQELILYPMLIYLLWQILYIAVVNFWRHERIERREYETSYRALVEKAKRGFVYQICGVLGPRYRKHLFVALQFLYTLLSMLLSYPCYHYHYAGVILGFIVLVVISYNGASFYIDVFSHRYHSDKKK